MREGYTNCYNCNGTGKVEIGGSWIVCFRTNTEIIICPVCGGSGEIPTDMDLRFQKNLSEMLNTDTNIFIYLVFVFIIAITFCFVIGVL